MCESSATGCAYVREDVFIGGADRVCVCVCVCVCMYVCMCEKMY